MLHNKSAEVDVVAGASIPPKGHGAFPPKMAGWVPPIFDYNAP